MSYFTTNLDVSLDHIWPRMKYLCTWRVILGASYFKSFQKNFILLLSMIYLPDFFKFISYARQLLIFLFISLFEFFYFAPLNN